MRLFKYLHRVAACLFAGMLLGACGDKNDSPEPEAVVKSADKEILEVSFDQFTGEVYEINKKESRVTVYVPWQNSWNLKPIIRHNGASISPESSVAQNFSKPVDYTITAEDGSTKTYTLIVASAKAGLVDVESQYVYGASFSDNFYYKLLKARDVATSQQERKLEISLGVTDASRYPNRDTRYFSNILLVTKAFDSYLHTYSWETQTNVTEALLILSKSASTTDSYWRPRSGSIKITSYNEAKKLVSGEFTNIKYMRGAAFPYYLTSGNFMNVPVEVQ
jgi:hypothetical protein